MVCLFGGLGAAGAQSIRPGWGAIPYADAAGTGVTFRAWAPQATSVNVAGTFNGWSASANALVKESPTSEIWSADVAAARTNDSFKFVVNGNQWRSDPRSRVLDAGGNNNSVVVPTNAFDWGSDSARITNASDLVIYEAHVGSFMGLGGTFSSFSNRLDYLENLSVSAIELMPINEFPSATSWGYNPAYPFAVEKDYGSPATLKALVRRAHQRGMVMLLDVVHNHWDGGSSLWEFDGATPGPYFYAADPYAFTPWGPRPEYSRPEVREYINDTFRMWLEEYHVSGFRWDAPKHIIYTTNDVFITPGLTMVTNALNLMAAEYPGTWNIAEDTKEISGFDYSWDFTFNWEIKSVLTQASDSARDMPTVARNVAGTPARIIYTESHDTAGDLNNGARLPTAISGGSPTDYYARKRAALGAALVMTSPGTPMILQGQELLETNQFSDVRAMDWTRTNSQAGTARLYRDLIRLRRNLEGTSAGLMGDATSTYQVDNVNKLIAYSRWNSVNTGSPVVVVANFANTLRTNYPVQFPEAGTWYALFNSDSTNYAADYGNAGSVEVAAAGEPATGAVAIGPYSALIFSRTPRTGMLVRETLWADLPAGNGDGVLDPGETIREQIVLWNKSSLAATNVSATLTALTPGVALEQGTSAYVAMAPDGAATNQTPFAYRLDPALACGSLIRFQLATAFNGQTLTNFFDHVVGHSANLPPATNVFASTNVNLAIADNSTTYSELTIAEAGAPVIGDVNVQLRINHNYDKDLVLALQHPDGSEVLLVNRRGRNGDHFGTGACGSGTNTVLDQGAAASIASGNAPFAGTYRPENTLDTFNGKPLNGIWRLRMKDSYAQNVGTALCWSIRAVYEQRVCDSTAFSNRAPTATSTHLAVSPSGPANFNLGGSDADGQPLTFEKRSAPGHGLFTLHSTDSGAATYSPVHGYVGTDTVDFVASDGLATSAVATVTLVMSAPADINDNGLPDDWELAHYTNLTTALPGGDSDGDGVPNQTEYFAHTDPQDSNSCLRLTQLLSDGGPTLGWSSVGGTRYRLEYSDSLAPENFLPMVRPLAEEIAPAAYGTPATLYFRDDFTNLPPPSGYLMRVYRIRVLNQ
jgi:1,4-alpha-glucan branching enzyme